MFAKTNNDVMHDAYLRTTLLYLRYFKVSEV